MPTTKNESVQLNKTLREKIDRLAKEHNRPIEEFLNVAVEEYVETAEKAAAFRRQHFNRGRHSPVVPQQEVDALFIRLLETHGGSLD